MAFDITTLLGIASALAIALAGVLAGSISRIFFNLHGLVLVLGGTAAALLINTPHKLLLNSLRALRLLFEDHSWTEPKPVVDALVRASQEVHSKGIGALRNVDRGAGGGFLDRAAQVAMEFNNPEQVTQILENEAAQELDRKNEIVNVYRTMSILLPMFGLVGTLTGIVDVLKQISNPEQVGGAMAVAVTTAFYGILLANLIAVPLAGKLRVRFRDEYQMKRIVIDGIHQMLKGTVPVVVERRLQAYLPDASSRA